MTSVYPRVEALVEATAAARPDHPAIIFGARQWTYAQVREEMDRRAAMLVAAGLGIGDPVAASLPVTDETALNYLACCRAGLPFFGASGKLTDAELGPLFWRVGTRATLTAAGEPHGAAPAIPALPVALPGEPPAAARAEALRRSATGDAEAVAFLWATSGTTGGAQKVVRVPHRAFTWRAARPNWREPADGVFYFPGRDFLSALNFTTFMAVGGTVILSHLTDPAAMEAEMAARGANILWSFPPVLRLLGALPDPPPPDLRLRHARVSSAPLTRETEAAFTRRYGARIANGYGPAEGGSLIGTPQAGAPPGSIGTPYDGVAVRIVDEEGVDVPDGEVGELVVRSPGVALGYVDSPEAEVRTFRDGWLWTGDLARRDADGYYFLEGRRALRINVGGHKVAPEEVEAVLERHPAVREVVVLAAPDPQRGEVVRAVIVPRGEPPTAAALRHWCRDQLAGYKVPRIWEFRAGPLPRSAYGKVLRHLL